MSQAYLFKFKEQFGSSEYDHLVLLFPESSVQAYAQSIVSQYYDGPDPSSVEGVYSFGCESRILRIQAIVPIDAAVAFTLEPLLPVFRERNRIDVDASGFMSEASSC